MNKFRTCANSEWRSFRIFDTVDELSASSCFLELQVEYKADSIRLPLLEMARKGHPLLQSNGKIDFMCQEVAAADPVTFSTGESYLVS